MVTYQNYTKMHGKKTHLFNTCIAFWGSAVVIVKGKGKGKAIPLQAWTGPENSRRLRIPDFKTIST